MKKMKLFPKTFLYTFFMLLFITTSMHLMIYFLYPKVYLSRMQDQLEKKMDPLPQGIKRNAAAEAGQIFSDFAKQNNVNVTVECAGSEVTYMGMDFQISLYTDADMVFDVSNLENAESIIVKNNLSRRIRDTGDRRRQRYQTVFHPCSGDRGGVSDGKCHAGERGGGYDHIFIAVYVRSSHSLFHCFFLFIFETNYKAYFSHAECHERYEKFKTGSSISCAG